MKAKELEKELARKNSVFEDEDQGIGSSDEGEEITTGQVGGTSTNKMEVLFSFPESDHVCFDISVSSVRTT